MQLKNDESRYGVVAQLFHWTIVVLIIVQFILANRADDLPRGAAKIAVLARHKSFGITILGLALLRLVWRWLNPVPAEPMDTPRWQRIAARASHIGLYVLLLITPLAGWLMSPMLLILGFSATMGLVLTAAYSPPFALVQGQNPVAAPAA